MPLAGADVRVMENPIDPQFDLSHPFGISRRGLDDDLLSHLHLAAAGRRVDDHRRHLGYLFAPLGVKVTPNSSHDKQDDNH